jgi:hypothetical protein
MKYINYWLDIELSTKINSLLIGSAIGAGAYFILQKILVGASLYFAPLAAAIILGLAISICYCQYIYPYKTYEMKVYLQEHKNEFSAIEGFNIKEKNPIILKSKVGNLSLIKPYVTNK